MNLLMTKNTTPLNDVLNNSINVFKLDPTALEDMGAVFYTDGGYRAAQHYREAPPPVGGYGVFGYVYTYDETKVGHGLQNADATDFGLLNRNSNWQNKEIDLPGGLKGHPRPVSVLGYIEMMDSSWECSSNNVAEVQATLNALDLVLQLGVKRVTIKSDSRYVLQGLLYCTKWSSNGWRKSDGEPIANIEIWQTIYKSYTDLINNGVTVNLMWIKGHSDSLGNCVADQLATKSMIAIINGYSPSSLNFFDPKGYWQPKVDVNPLLAEKHLFIDKMDCELLKSKGYAVYKFGTLGDDVDEYTKPLSTKGIAIIAPVRPDPVVDRLVDLARNANTYNELAMFIGRMDIILKPAEYLELMNNGTMFLRKNIFSQQFSLPNKTLILEEMPSILLGAHTILGAYDFLLKIFADYVTSGLSSDQFHIDEITDWVYESNVKKNKTIVTARPNIERQLELMADVKVTNAIRRAPLQLLPGRDLPKFRTLVKIAHENTKVYLVSWPESDRSYRHATIIRSEFGIGIWSGIYSNLKKVSKE